VRLGARVCGARGERRMMWVVRVVTNNRILNVLAAFFASTLNAAGWLA
jgi:hypothetical protein